MSVRDKARIGCFSIELINKVARALLIMHDGPVVPSEDGRPAEGGLLDVFWSGRRANEFDQRCQR